MYYKSTPVLPRMSKLLQNSGNDWELKKKCKNSLLISKNILQVFGKNNEQETELEQK